MRIVISEFMDTPPSMLRARFDVRYEPELVDRRNGLLQAMADADALIVRNRSQVDAALLASAPRLRAVGRLGVGLDNIDLTACARGIAVVPATGANARAVAEYVIGTLLVLLRGAYGASAAVADGSGRAPRCPTDWSAWPHAGRGGLRRHRPPGRAGARPGHARRRPRAAGRPSGLGRMRRGIVLAGRPAGTRADAVSLHLPLTPDTRRLFDAARISRMRAGAVLINTARRHRRRARPGRGPARRPAERAALDVFEAEPRRRRLRWPACWPTSGRAG